jgi:Protein of unknown function (DUF2630)
MEDSQIHGTIEQLVAEEHELWQREGAGNATTTTGGACNSSRSRSTSAGTCSASAAPVARRG